MGYRALWDCVRVQRPQLAAEVLLFLTDTLHWRQAIDGSVSEARCRPCNAVCSVRHLLSCPALSRRREDAADSVRDFFGDARWQQQLALKTTCDRWVEQGDRDVRSLLVRIGLASGVRDSVAVLAASFGAFSAEAALAFTRRWQVPAEQLSALRLVLFVAASRTRANRAR